ncbi:MAG: cell surface protein SprA [Bacteroidia bacterium]
MYKAFKYTLLGAISLALLSVVFIATARVTPYTSFFEPSPFLSNPVQPPPDTPAVNLPYPYNDQSGKAPLYFNNNKGLKLHDPSNIKTQVVYDPDSNVFNVNQKIGDLNYREPTFMTYDEYIDYNMHKSLKDYWKQRVHAESLNNKKQKSNIIPPIKINSVIFDRIFGGNTVDIRPQGSAELIFGANINRTDNPALPVKQRRITTFDFNEKIQLNVVGKIGDKLKLTTNYNTEATFDFENQMKLEYTGYEDEIIKKIEAGNVSLPLSSSLITGSQTLFGVKAQLQFGRLTATTVFSQEKGKKSEVNVTGGAQITNFEVMGDNYDANKHFFLSTYFREQYNAALANLPVVNSQINITRVEVWVTNKTATTDNTRNILALTDLGETRLRQPAKSFVVMNQPLGSNPASNANSLYFKLVNQAYPLPALNPGNTLRNINNITNTLATLATPTYNFQPTSDYEKVQFSKKLGPNDFTINKRLGYISLNAALNYDEVLAVSYQYTIGNAVYQVGEFSDDGISGDQVLFVKMLKSTNVSPRSDTLLWNLMMKNIYSIGAYQVNPQDFRCDIIYNNPATATDIRYIPEGLISGKPLIQVLNADHLNTNLDPTPDGIYDFIDGVTIDAAKGRVIIPVVEPFGDYLASKLYDPAAPDLAGNPVTGGKYPFYDLYDSTRTSAQQNQKKNRFKLKGQFKGAASNDISLNAVNVPQGSVMVTSGGVPLTENVDYTVDYALGRVKIINEGLLQSGAPIKISLESNSLFNIQTKSLIGTHLDYRFNKDFTIGGTILNLTERPLTQKVNIGDEPINNTMIGTNLSYRTEAPWLTRLVDKIPLIQTKEMSTIAATGEWAALIPGYNKAIGAGGTSYIDDFEGTQSAIDLKQQSAWSISSIPNDPVMFPESALIDTVAVGYNRARLSWYVIDPLFMRLGNNITPANISKTDMSNHFQREIFETEIFPNKQSSTGQPVPLGVLDLAFYPNERGPYNFDVVPNPHAHSAGLNANGTLKNPASRWGGMMRQITTNDFEAANIQFIQFWMMDPFNQDNLNPNVTGDLYFDLGDISEDILRDSRKEYENGFVLDPNNMSQFLAGTYDQTIWGYVPTAQTVVNAFANDNATRTAQDVGYDGLSDANERTYHQWYLNKVAAAFTTTSGAYDSAWADPCGDDFHYYRGTDYDNQSIGTLARYKKFCNSEGNSLPNGVTNRWGYNESYATQSSTIPNTEDVNHDNTLSETEAYFEYHVKLTANDVNKNNVGRNFITDYAQPTVPTVDGRNRPIGWFQFRIPISEYVKKVGTINDFKSIRFIRVYFKNVDKPVICRMAKLELVRDEWRRYNYSLLTPGEYIPNDDATTTFNLAAVNIEENGSRIPVNYVLPPGIVRQQSAATSAIIQLNEQSLSLKICGLKDGDARAAYKNVTIDVRSYKKIRMFVHAEAGPNGEPLHNNDLECFMRLGTDFTDNYYEYSIPLAVTPPGNYSTNAASAVWPDANLIELAFSELQSYKQTRNEEIVSGKAILTIERQYELGAGKKISIKGSPNLAALRTIMIGVRNPKKMSRSDPDDGLSKCGEVWVDELRLTDFDESGGWAAIGRMTSKLADFGTLTVAGNYSTPGFGSLESKVSTRQKETDVGVDVSSQLELGKFFPAKVNLRIPMFVGFSETVATPQYNPLDPDILVKNLSAAEQSKIKGAIETFTRRRSLNFTNVKKERSKGTTKKTHFYDPENIALNYAYTEVLSHSPTIDHSILRSYRGGLSYNFSKQPKNLKPFGKNVFLNKHKYLTLIKDINFNTSITSMSFLTDINRSYSENLNRNTTGVSDIPLLPTYNKTFAMTRNYDLKYDLTKTLKIDFNAMNESRVLEPLGAIDTQQKRDSVWNSMLGLGSNTHYHQTANINYTIPINKIPIFDFATATVRYTASYDWLRSPFSADSIGNTIQNSSQWTWATQGNMINLYNKIPYFKKINAKKPPGQTPKTTSAPVNPNAQWVKNSKTKQDSLNKLNKTKKDTSKQTEANILEYVARAIMAIKSVSVNYTTNRGTILPGYRPTTTILGMDNNFRGPGVGFLFGEQDHFGGNHAHYGIYAADEGWLVHTHSIFNPFARTSTKNLNGRANLEPFPDFKVELNANIQQADNRTEYFRWNPVIGDYTSETPTEGGNFSMSYIMIRTTLKFDNADHSSELFKNFTANRYTISQRLGLNPNNPAGGNTGINPTTGYYNGYSAQSQSVLIPAFLAAYTGQSFSKVSLNPFLSIPKPNWRFTYDGLSKNEKMKKYFKSFTLSHAYRSTYAIGSFSSNLDFVDPSGSGFGNGALNSAGDYLSKYVIPSVTLSEQFSPLIGADMTLKTNLLVKVEIKKDRTLSLSVTSTQITEISGRELTVGFGYPFKMKDRKLFPNYMKKPVHSDLKVKIDFSYRNNQTVIRKMDPEFNQLTSGTDLISVKSSADYMLSDKLSVRLFWDYIRTNPLVSTSFLTSNTHIGISLRLTL